MLSANLAELFLNHNMLHMMVRYTLSWLWASMKNGPTSWCDWWNLQSHLQNQLMSCGGFSNWHESKSLNSSYSRNKLKLWLLPTAEVAQLVHSVLLWGSHRHDCKLPGYRCKHVNIANEISLTENPDSRIKWFIMFVMSWEDCCVGKKDPGWKTASFTSKWFPAQIAITWNKTSTDKMGSMFSSAQ